MELIDETRVCTVCGKEKDLSLFRKIRNDYSKVRQDKLKEWINSLKTPCIICGEADPICIDWHHVNPNDKSFQVSYGNHSKESILKEIQNCHRKVHAGKIELEVC
jgi:hypothetical protein